MGRSFRWDQAGLPQFDVDCVVPMRPCLFVMAIQSRSCLLFLTRIWRLSWRAPEVRSKRVWKMDRGAHKMGADFLE